MEIEKIPQKALLIVKRDAVEDGLTENIIEFVDSIDRIKVVSKFPIELTEDEVLHMYKPELDQFPTERREILMAMAAVSMRGVNVVAGLQISDCTGPGDAFSYLNEVKGTTNGINNQSTIRARFPFMKPPDYDDYSFWFRSPFFIRNRVHVPDSTQALRNVLDIVGGKGVSRGEVFGE